MQFPRFTVSILGAVAVLAACEEPQSGDWAYKQPLETSTTSTTSTTTPTEPTTSTPTTSTTDTGPDPCLAPLPAAPRPVATIDITTEEDFDFDADGYIIYQSGSIVAENTSGDYHVIASAPGGDPSGLQVNSENNLVVVSDVDSTVHLIYRSGGIDIIMSGFSLPNGIEIGANDRVYVSDYGSGQVRWTDPATGDSGQVTNQLNNPDNLVLSPDEQTLYVATTDGIAVLERIAGTDDWEPTPTAYLASGLGPLYVVEIDSCGNLYTAVGTEIYRLDMQNLVLEGIANLPSGWFVSSLRFGNGVAEFDRWELYATMRSDIHVIDIGLNGRHHPTTP